MIFASQILFGRPATKSLSFADPVRERTADHGGWFCASYPSYSLEALRPSSTPLAFAAYDPERAKLCVHSGVSVGLAAHAMDLWRIFWVSRASCRLLSEETACCARRSSRS